MDVVSDLTYHSPDVAAVAVEEADLVETAVVVVDLVVEEVEAVASAAVVDLEVVAVAASVVVVVVEAVTEVTARFDSWLMAMAERRCMRSCIYNAMCCQSAG